MSSSSRFETSSGQLTSYGTSGVPQVPPLRGGRVNLFDACKRGDISDVRRALCGGADPNARSNSKVPPPTPPAQSATLQQKESLPGDALLCSPSKGEPVTVCQQLSPVVPCRRRAAANARARPAAAERCRRRRRRRKAGRTRIMTRRSRSAATACPPPPSD